MALVCSLKHKKPVCDRCDAGTNCTKCCPCQPRTRGRPRKSDESETPYRINPEREARVHSADVSVGKAVEDCSEPTCSTHTYCHASSQAHIIEILECMGCEDYNSSVRKLPHVDVRQQVLYATNDEIDAAGMHRVENVFWRGVKAWARIILPNLRLKADADLKTALSIKSVVAAIGEITEAEPIDDDQVPSVSAPLLDMDMLTTIPTTIRDVLVHEKRYTSTNARRFLVPLASLPSAQVASLLAISKSSAKRLLFQAKVDKLYLTHGVELEEHSGTQYRVHRDVIHSAVDFIYSDENIGRLAWEARKRSPNRNPRWKDLENVSAMRLLVLKHDVATMFRVYSDKYKNALPGKPPLGKTLFYSITNNITGGGKQQEARAGVDYIKVNFHIDNFVIVDKIIDVIAPLSDLDHTLRDELCGLRSHVYTFLSYGYAAHAREGVRVAEDREEHSHLPQEHEAQQFKAYKELEKLLSDPDMYDVPATQVEFVRHIQKQLNCCGLARGAVESKSNFATTHSPVFQLDLAPNRKPNRNPKAGGQLECNACRSTFLFYDRLRRMALTRLDEDPTRLPEMADVLLALHQCERRSYRYMAHVMLAAQQAYQMKMAIAEMDCNTAYMVFDFKQKFLAKGFREGGDSYYRKKRMLWWGAGVHVKANTPQDIRSDEPIMKPYVEIDFTAERARLKDLQVNEVSGLKTEEDCEEGMEEEHCVLVEVEDGGEEVEDGGEEVEDGGEEVEDGGEEVEDGGEEVEDGGEEVEDGGEEVEDGGEEVEDGGEEVEDGGEEAEDGGEEAEDGGEEVEDGGEEVEDGGEEVEDGGEEVEDGGEEVEDGGEEVEDGGEEVEDGGEEVEDGGEEVEDGGDEVEDGGDEVEDGGEEGMEDGNVL